MGEETEPGSTGHVLVAYVAEQLARVRELEGPVRSGAEDAVHQMRVATRRLRSLLATYRPALQPGAAEPLRAELRWLATALGAARDTEVMRARLLDLLAGEPEELVLGPVARRLETAMDDREARARESVRDALDSERYAALLDALDRFVAQPPFTEAGDRPARKVLPTLLARDWKRMRRRARDVAEADAVERDHALHELRKAAKRMRYAAELAAPALGEPWSDVAARCEALQDLLGEHQDTVVSRQTLRAVMVQAVLNGENGFTFGRLHALEQARAVDVEREYAAMVADGLPKKARRWA